MPALSSMGLGFGLESDRTVYKRKFRWLFKIPDISAEGVKALPPQKAARPSLSFKENECQHINETIYFPGKPEFKTFNLVLYDLACQDNPVFDWIKRLYDPQNGKYKFPIMGDSTKNLKQNANLELYDRCGNCIEKWRYENCWPQSVEWQDLDMGASDVLVVELALRYDRAYIVKCENEETIDPVQIINDLINILPF
jgi:phage tail-like protein